MAKMASCIRILHTSDWHLGVELHGQGRLNEQADFLKWLKTTLENEEIDVLLVSGDIFDTYAPPVAAQKIYYDFLADILSSRLPNLQIFITAGNHDSPQFLGAPSDILSRLKIHVIASAPENENENKIFEIKNAENDTALILCAVPFLRERDLKIINDLGENDDTTKNYSAALVKYYQGIFELAKKKAAGKNTGKKDGKYIPIVMTGHFYLQGSSISDDVSERVREIGRLSGISINTLPAASYLAMGHLHGPQIIGGHENYRYSGSPIPMSFSEAKQKKSVVLVEYNNSNDEESRQIITTIEIPQSQKLEQIKGSPETILERLSEIKKANENIWIDIQVTDFPGDLFGFWSEIDALSGAENDNQFKILIKQDMRKKHSADVLQDNTTEVSALLPISVFENKLAEEGIEDTEIAVFKEMFMEMEALARTTRSAEDDN